jgi:hypothetical protein
MGGAYQAPILPRDEYGQAVRHQNRAGSARLGREAGVGLGRGVRARVFLEGDDLRAVNLREPEGLGADGLGEMAAILRNGARVVPDMGGKVEGGVRGDTCALPRLSP